MDGFKLSQFEWTENWGQCLWSLSIKIIICKKFRSDLWLYRTKVLLQYFFFWCKRHIYFSWHDYCWGNIVWNFRLMYSLLKHNWELYWGTTGFYMCSSSFIYEKCEWFNVCAGCFWGAIYKISFRATKILGPALYSPLAWSENNGLLTSAFANSVNF